MPNQQENNCDCDACRFNAEQDAKRAAFFNQLQKQFDQANKPVEVTPEDKELAKGRTVVISKTLREEIVLDRAFMKVTRLPLNKVLLYSGQARMATSQEQTAMKS